MWDRKELKRRGKQAFRANTWRCILVSFILFLLTAGSAAGSRSGSEEGGASFSQIASQLGISVHALAAILAAVVGGGLVVSILMTMFIRNPLKVGCTGFYIRNADEPCGLDVVTDAFRGGQFINIFLTMLLMDVFIILWSLLLVIPGIAAAYSYRMVPYLLADEPDLEPMEVLRRSKEMMRGSRWDAFVLDLSFIGWHILSALTAGVLAAFFVNPYVAATNAELYQTLKGNLPR